MCVSPLSRFGLAVLLEEVSATILSPAETDYLEFAGRPHLMMAAETWAEIAGAIEGWIASVAEKTGVAAGTAPA